LGRGNIKLRDDEDSLAWDFNKLGWVYSTRLGYIAMTIFYVLGRWFGNGRILKKICIFPMVNFEK
jgi:hypothetical protein